LSGPRIGITSSPRRPRAYYETYAAALRSAGAEPVLLSPDQHRLEGLDGLLLPGGEDIEPARYGAEPDEHLGDVDPDLDSAEIDLVRQARDQSMPILGICRGQKVINVALGGTLHVHLPEHEVRAHGRRHLAHALRVEPGSELAAAAGSERVEVNSLHHQAVKDLAPGLRPTARSDDGIVEALQSEDGLIVAVQCHPEELVGDLGWARELFEQFVAKARHD